MSLINHTFGTSAKLQQPINSGQPGDDTFHLTFRQ